MAKEFFEHFNLRQTSLDLIAQVNAVLSRYEAMGYRLTLRQTYYQLVAANIIPNSEKSYDNIGVLVTKGRLMGLIDWDMLEDRTRNVQRPAAWARPKSLLEAAANQFRINLWDNQPNHVRVLVEKQALEGILIPVCTELGVAFAANRGYSSASAMYEMGKELEDLRRQGKTIHVLYLGDHDPSGIDMTRDVEERLALFSDGDVHVDRLALNMPQIEEYGPPENPAKVSDSRFFAYQDRFGDSSWELDALDPTVLADLVRTAVADRRDDVLFRARQRREGRMRRELASFVTTSSRRSARDYDDPIGYEEMLYPADEQGGIYIDDAEVLSDLETNNE